LLVRFAAMPTRWIYDQSADLSDQHPQIVLPCGQSGPYYILLHGREGAGSGQAFTLEASVPGLSVIAIDPPAIMHQSQVIVSVTGTGFTPQTTVSLRGPGGQVVQATQVLLINACNLEAAFDLTGAAAGNYTFQVADGTQTAQATTAFPINPPLPLVGVGAHIEVPGVIRVGAIFTVIVNVTNVPPGMSVGFTTNGSD